MINHLPEQTLARVFEEVGMGVTIVGSGGQIRWANSQGSELLGWCEDCTTNSVLDCHPEHVRGKVQDRLAHAQLKEYHRVLERNGRLIENQYFPTDVDGERGMLIITRDVTERETTARALKNAAITDGLTGLFNRQRLNDLLANPEETQGIVGVIVADINGLKVVNDDYGHLAGDQLIMQTAQLLRQSCRKNDMVFRIGGDEFLILVYDEHEETLLKVMGRIKQSSDCSHFGTPGYVCLSVGACLLAEAAGMEAAISMADGRMYEAKRSFYEAAATTTAIRGGH